MATNTTSDGDIITTGGCLCGAVRYQVTGRPLRAAFCHCTLCQRRHGAPFVHTVHYGPSSNFTWTPESLKNFQYYLEAGKPHKKHHRCATCGASVATTSTLPEHEGLWALLGAQLDKDENGRTKNWELVKPTAHWFYDNRMEGQEGKWGEGDGLGKWAAWEGVSERLG